MKLLTLTVSFLVAISFLLAPQINLKKTIQQEFAQPSLPRKLINLNHETAVKSSSEEDSMPLDKFRQASSGTKQHGKEENVMNIAAEKEIPNKSEYFTMDYGWVKRRRPIHNKQIPSFP